jgi:predicted small lipoprotein YifL
VCAFLEPIWAESLKLRLMNFIKLRFCESVMRKTGLSLLLAWALLMLSACGGKGDSAAPPSDVAAKALDGAVTLTWTATPGVEYWAFYGKAASISPTNWTSIAGSKALVNVTSPLTITGLTNGDTYAFTINGRTSGGPGGAGSTSLAVAPRIAGQIWTAGSPIATASLNSVTAVGQGLFSAPVVIAVGSGGAVYTSADGITWTVRTSGVTTDLYGVAVNPVGSRYLAVGAGGVILSSTDFGITWAAATSGSTATLTSAALNSSGTFVVVGAGGVVLSSTDGTTWTSRTSGTTNNLNAVRYLNGGFVAVGDGGSVLTSADGVTWNAGLLGGAGSLRAVAYGAGRYVTTGDGNRVYGSTDAAAWSATTVGAAGTTFYDVVVGSQFVAVGSQGSIFTSTDGLAWTQATSSSTEKFNGVAFQGTGYIAVGSAGINSTAY